MHEILSNLSSRSRVLDLGSAHGSFDLHRYEPGLVRVDIDAGAMGTGGSAVAADASMLPFPDGTFDAVICNHGLEHFTDFEGALKEIGRVMKRGGAFYAAVPGSTTVCDRLYRWLARGGGHVNRFVTPSAFVTRVEQVCGFEHAGTRPLYTSFSFLNRRNIKGRAPGKLILFGNGNELFLVVASFLLRLADRVLGTSWSLYGWCSYFGSVGGTVATEPWTNVCARCGSGHPSLWLEAQALMSRRCRLIKLYTCPACGARNIFTDDTAYGSDRFRLRGR